jgi:hypothetical protein
MHRVLTVLQGPNDREVHHLPGRYGPGDNRPGDNRDQAALHDGRPLRQLLYRQGQGLPQILARSSPARGPPKEGNVK